MRSLISKSKNLFLAPQASVLSAATIIMLMVVASRVLGLMRQRVLAHFFAPSDLALFFAAFRLPDLVFEVFFFGMFSSAFIPVFTKALKKDGEAWDIAGRVVTISLLIFLGVAGVLALGAHELYRLFTPGFSQDQTNRIADLARVLFAAQGFFVISYVLTAVLESLRRFLIPALAPLFYNLGIILGTIFLSSSLGLFAPAVGVVIGASLHLLIQLPLATKMGFRFSLKIKPNRGVKEIGRLALPRVVDLSFQQAAKTVELGLASLISTASYTYFYFANSLQLLPVNLFGTSLAKAAFPTLSSQEDDLEKFRKTLFSTLYQIIFLSLPLATALIVLRIPLVRLVFGTDIFDWEATVQTGMVLSAFAFGIVFQASYPLLARAFYALHDTRTPVAVSLMGVILMIGGDFILIKGFALPVWALAASFSFALGIQTLFLFYLLNKKINTTSALRVLLPIGKTILSSLLAGSVMYFLLKFFDRSVWVKRLSFLGETPNLPFESFVIDTRYTFNLLLLTLFVGAIGALVFLISAWILRSQELFVLVRMLRRKRIPAPPPEPEPLTIDSN
jgi:putative peptidoglycan lipid II flippase